MAQRYRNLIFGTIVTTEATNLGAEWEPISDKHPLGEVRDSGKVLSDLTGNKAQGGVTPRATGDTGGRGDKPSATSPRKRAGAR